MAIKGRRKRLKTGFKAGHKRYSSRRQTLQAGPQNTPLKSTSWRRLDLAVYRRVVRKSSSPSLEHSDTLGKLLRPLPAQPSISDKYLESQLESGRKYHGGMAIVDKEKMVDMFNACQQQHSAIGECTSAEFTIFKEIKKGICWKYILNCKNCSFISDAYNMYKDVQSDRRGAKAAAPNVALQVGIQDSPIGNTKIRQILATADIDPPSRTAMQRLSNNVGLRTVILNEADMSQRIEGLKDINELRALDLHRLALFLTRTIFVGNEPGSKLVVLCQMICCKLSVFAGATRHN
ncbi:uncharacterized protein [Ptychodera flava]|uniref:uncharacterized protein n=1 Tax=Ptychodera flava TaxID=63121 RepID=UPI00396A3E02